MASDERNDEVTAFSFYTELENSKKASGVLTIEVGRGKNILGKCTRPYSMFSLRVQVGEVSKSFKAVSHNHGSPIWDEKIHLGVTVYANPENPMNRVLFALFAQGSFPGEESQILGMMHFHLHEIIRAVSVNKTEYRLTSFDKDIGQIEVSMHFFYGRFGYGHSLQLDDGVQNSQMQVKETLYPVIRYDRSKLERKQRDGRKDDKAEDKYSMLDPKTKGKDGRKDDNAEEEKYSKHKWFKEANHIIDQLSKEKNVGKRIAMMRQMVNGEFATSEIPRNLGQVEHSRLTNMEIGGNRDLLIPASLMEET